MTPERRDEIRQWFEDRTRERAEEDMQAREIIEELLEEVHNLSQIILNVEQWFDTNPTIRLTDEQLVNVFYRTGVGPFNEDDLQRVDRYFKTEADTRYTNLCATSQKSPD